MQEKYGNDKGVVLVALSDEPSNVVAPFVKKQKINYIVGVDSDKTFERYDVHSYPTIFVVDSEGGVVYKGHTADEAERALEKTLKKKPPKTKAALGDAAGTAALAKADELFTNQEYAKALKEYRKVAKAQKGSEIGKKAKARVEEIKGDEKIMAAISDAETKKNCENWLSMARALAKSGKDDEAVKYYQRVVDEYPDSSYAQAARTELAKLSG